MLYLHVQPDYYTVHNILKQDTVHFLVPRKYIVARALHWNRSGVTFPISFALTLLNGEASSARSTDINPTDL